MIEYLIRMAGEQAWPAVPPRPRGRGPDLSGFGLVGHRRWGDYRLRRGDTEISFAGDVVGRLVSFDGPIFDAEARRMIEIIASHIEMEVGESIESSKFRWQE